MKTFQKLQKDLGMEVALESFRKVLAAVEEDIFHDPLGCSECRVRGDWEFCKRSCYHPQHDLHECPEGQVSGVQPTTHWHQGFSVRGWSLGGDGDL